MKLLCLHNFFFQQFVFVLFLFLLCLVKIYKCKIIDQKEWEECEQQIIGVNQANNQSLTLCGENESSKPHSQ